MVTTIQVDEKTLIVLKKVKAELAAASYDEAITKMAAKQLKPQKSMAGSLANYYKNYSTKTMSKELKEERKQFDRF